VLGQASTEGRPPESVPNVRRPNSIRVLRRSGALVQGAMAEPHHVAIEIGWLAAQRSPHPQPLTLHRLRQPGVVGSQRNGVRSPLVICHSETRFGSWPNFLRKWLGIGLTPLASEFFRYGLCSVGLAVDYSLATHLKRCDVAHCAAGGQVVNTYELAFRRP
jgi:hypothetical protein